MLRDLFQRKKKYTTVTAFEQANNSPKKIMGKSAVNLDENIDEQIWMKCKKCEDMVLIKDYEKNDNICPICGKHGRLKARDRIKNIIDKGSFEEYYTDLESLNPLEFPDYEKKIDKAKSASNLNEAVITGRGRINGIAVNIAVMDSNFMMGSMGSVVGEKITRLVENSAETGIPLIIFCASGGARMQEGILSLMQMAKTSAAIAKLDDKKNLYISVLTDPTTGGVSASFAMLGDIIIAEPETLIGFAGPRVVQQTIRQNLPEGFQTAEFLQDKGFVDIICKRYELKDKIHQILDIHGFSEDEDNE
ncbi:MAG: acetyl-CoA carboxylase, carboxyltransferase subunit beta [Andreesenia angusta]|nr:acetyl-CoA carboxylase, carboxyltransferase subunit beta [Andreesenia angusta]